MSARRHYLDFNATHPLRAEAREAMRRAMDEVAANPSSVHAEGRAARTIIERGREAVAELAGAAPAEVVFTSGATEAANWVLGARWDVIFVSRLEHDCVLKPIAASGAKVVWLPVTTLGAIDADAARVLIEGEASSPFVPRLLCVTAANNETGVMQPIAALSGIARECGVKVFSDAVQAVGRVAEPPAREADFVSLSAHKIGGPMGSGALVIRGGGEPAPLLRGGGQERNRRAGTENLLGIAGFGAAARVARQEAAMFTEVARLRDDLTAGLREWTPELVVLGEGAPRLANTACVAVPGWRAEAVVIQLDLAGISVSAGAACSSGKVAASAALEAMGISPEIARSAVRFSLGVASSGADVKAAITAWQEIAARRRDAA